MVYYRTSELASLTLGERYNIDLQVILIMESSYMFPLDKIPKCSVSHPKEVMSIGPQHKTQTALPIGILDFVNSCTCSERT